MSFKPFARFFGTSFVVALLYGIAFAEESDPKIRISTAWSSPTLHASVQIENIGAAPVCVGMPFAFPVHNQKYSIDSYYLNADFEEITAQGDLFPSGPFIFVFPPETKFSFDLNFAPLAISAPSAEMAGASLEEQRRFANWSVEQRKVGKYRMSVSIRVFSCSNAAKAASLAREVPFFLRQTSFDFNSGHEVEVYSDTFSVSHPN